MVSIAQNDIAVIEYLIRNFSKRYTIREIAKHLKISAAGAHKVLKKLESYKLVIAEKLGTGLFYEINLINNSAKHISAFVLSLGKHEFDNEIKELKGFVSAIIVLPRKVLLVSHVHEVSKVEELSHEHFKGRKPIVVTEEKLVDKIRSKDEEAVSFIRDGQIVYGENVVIRCIQRYR